MTDSDDCLEQFYADLQLNDRQREIARNLLDVTRRIEQLEAAIRAMTAPQRNAVMRYWIGPSVHHGLNVELYRRTFFELSQMLESSLFDA